MKKILPFGVLLLISACNNVGNPSEGDAGKFSRLESVTYIMGTWEMKISDGVLTEQWEYASDTEWHGYGIMTSTGGDTLFKEKLKLVQIGDTLWYMPTVANQNAGMEVRFKEKDLTTTKVVFENMEHDFPQRIVYEKTSDSTLYAYIEGTKAGKTIRNDFKFTKAMTK